MGQELFNLIERDRENLIEFTKEIIKIPSVYDPEKEGFNEEKVANYIYKFLVDLGFEVYIDEVEPGRPNVIAILKGEQPGKTLLYEGHTDVVTAGDLDEWNYPPFDAVIEDNKLYGRGACDTKGNLAAMIYAAKALKDSEEDFKGTVKLCIPVDEEGFMIGIKDFINKGWADDVDAGVICEPEDNELCVAQKGAIRAVIKVFGKMAHGAMPLAGINPNWRMAKIINELYQLQQSEISRLGEHKYLGYPSITPTILQAPPKGEAQINVIPSECMTTLDIRTVPGQDHEELKTAIRKILNDLEQTDEHFKAQVEFIEERPWTKTDETEEIVSSMEQAYKIMTGNEPVYNGVPGATDGTFLNYLKDIPIVTTGAGERTVPHKADEYVDLDQLVETTKLYALTAKEYLR